MKNVASSEKLTGTGTDIASRVKNLFSGSPVNRRKRVVSLESPTTPSIPLTELIARDGLPVPFIVKKIVHHIESQGLDQVGLYRINGNVKNIEKLRAVFDRVGDADFNEEDISTVGGLLKLFLRELPDSVIPGILVNHFVSVQQSYSSTASPEALDALRLCLRYLPESNYNLLKFLIKHLTNVAEYTELNKMTSVSLSIVFGPNLFHCGDGLEGLKLQGYSNSIVCRMIQHYKELFIRSSIETEGTTPTSTHEIEIGSNTPTRSNRPTKPVPYQEYMASKNEHALSPGSSHDLDVTQSERSIDEAIYEQSNVTLSPTSPSHLPLDDQRPDPISSKATHISQQPLIISENSSSTEASEQRENGIGFQRRNAKRWVCSKPRDETELTTSQKEGPISHDRDPILRHHQVPTREDLEHLQRTPSPYSHSSTGTSPPTSPVLTSRTSSVVNSVIGASIRDFLFRPPQLTESAKKSIHSQGSKHTIYGLLLPETSPLIIPPPHSHSTVSSTREVQRRNDNTNTDAPLNGIVKRRVKNLKGQRNRKSALHGKDILFDSSGSPVGDMEIQLLSVSPEHQGSLAGAGGVVMESRVGKVLDLVKQFDETEPTEDKGRVSSPRDGTSVRKLSSDAFDVFQRSSIIMGNGPPSQKSKVSLASSTSSPSHPQAHNGGVRGQYLSALSASDEEVFGSSLREQAFRLPSSTGRRDPLSTTTSDDVFLSPARTTSDPVNHRHNTRELSVVEEFDQLLPTTTSSLKHLTLTRPKGPPSRRKPRHFSAPELASSHTMAAADDTKKRHSHDIQMWPLSLEENEDEKQQNSSAEHSPSITQRAKRPTTKGVFKEEGNRVQSSSQDPSVTANSTTASTSNGSDPSPPSSLSAYPRKLPHLGKYSDREIQQPDQAEASSQPNQEVTKLPQEGFGLDSSHQEIRRLPDLPESGSVNSVRKVPQPDLIALAPEQKQVMSAVKRGWAEGNGFTESNPHSMKDLSRKIHEMKNVVRDFESQFIQQHSRKPSSHERSPIRKELIELAKLKKMFNELKESKREERFSQTLPAEISSKVSPVESPSHLLKTADAIVLDHTFPHPIRQKSHSLTIAKVDMAEEITVDTPTHYSRQKSHSLSIPAEKEGVSIITNQVSRSRKKSNPTMTGKVGVVKSVGQDSAVNLEELLKKIMLRLETSRKECGRPDELELMDESQVQSEKQAIQKALLNYEKHYGRPQSHDDKGVMRPLYDRYRAVKRACHGSSRERQNSGGIFITPRGSLEGAGDPRASRIGTGVSHTPTRGSISGPGLDLTTDTLPSVTLLGNLTQSVDISDLSKSGDGLLLSPGKQSGQHTERRGSSDGRGRKRTQSAGVGSGNAKQLPLAEEKLHSASNSNSLDELNEENSLLLTEKAGLRKILKDFENGFIALNGRSLTKQDRKPMEKEYNQYKNIKSRLKTLETQMDKMDPQRTI